VAIERQELTMETLGLTLAEGKALLAGVQDFVVAQPVQPALEQPRAGPHGGQPHTSKVAAIGQHAVGPGQGAPSAVASLPLSKRRSEDRSPEMLYWETKWSSRILFTKTADLWKEVLRWRIE
jgi:hypothetical protein